MVANSYGKSNVAVIKVGTHPGEPPLRRLTVTVDLGGDFANAYLLGDAGATLPQGAITDLVLYVAENHKLDSLETFGHDIAEALLKKFEQVHRAEVTVEEAPMATLNHVNAENVSAFGHTVGGERHGTVVRVRRGANTTVTSRLHNLSFVRVVCADAGGVAPKDVLSSTLDVTFDYYVDPFGGSVDFAAAHRAVRGAVARVLSTHPSTLIQATLLAVGKAVIQDAEDVKEVHVSMQHHRHEARRGGVFVPASNVLGRGVASATIRRHHVAIPVPFKWNASFDVKDDLLNRQHSDLFDLILALDKDRKNAALLSQIMEHAVKHFADEEAIFAASGYDTRKQEAHKRVHRRFVEQAVKATKGKPVTDATMLFLKKWLVEHIMGADMQYARFLEAKQKAAQQGQQKAKL